jgi:hypothetical protein
MHKDEMIHLHQFLVYILKYLGTNKDMQTSYNEYISLNISPNHIHRTKAEHKSAIFVLSNTITEVINKDKNYTLCTGNIEWTFKVILFYPYLNINYYISY